MFLLDQPDKANTEHEIYGELYEVCHNTSNIAMYSMLE